MKIATFLCVVLVLCGSSTHSYASGAELDCATHTTIRPLIIEFYRSFTTDRNNDNVDKMMADPIGAACWFVSDLRIVHGTTILSSQLSKVGNRPILAIRGLRLITGCKDFRAGLRVPTVVSSEDPRWSLLLNDGIHNVPFFKTWMSRDTVYVAPQDVQVQVIGNWSEWFQQESGDYHFERCQHVDDWY